MSWQPENKSKPSSFQAFTSQHWVSPPGYVQHVQPGSMKWPGLTSLLIGVLCGFALAAGTVVATFYVIEYGEDVESFPQEAMPGIMAAGCSIIFGIMGAFVGLIFGIVGLAIANSNRILAAVGLAINALLLLGIGGLMLMGMMR